MSYPQSLDECSEKALLEEILARLKDQRDGKCDYCHKPIDSSWVFKDETHTSCRFPARHHRPQPSAVEQIMRDDLITDIVNRLMNMS